VNRLIKVTIMWLSLIGILTALYIGLSRYRCLDRALPEAHADSHLAQNKPYVSLEKAIVILQPRTSQKRAVRLARAIRLESLINGLDPKLVLALAMRESSLHPLVEIGKIRGPRGELGLMQIMPSGAAMRFRPKREGKPCNLRSAWCSVATATRYLRHLRDQCGGSKWVWIGAYSSRSCPSEKRANTMQGVQTVKHYYAMIAGG